MIIDRNFLKIQDLIDKSDEQKRSGPLSQQIKSIKVNKSFAEKLNKTLSNENKSINNSNMKSTKTSQNSINNCPEVREPNQSPEPSKTEILLTSKPNPVPKPPRTFAHDLYMEFKFNKTNENKSNSSEKVIPIYSLPNKDNKLKNRLRSQSDSQVINKKKSNQFQSNDTIYDDCINTKSIDKTIKSKLLSFSCLKLKRR